MASYVQTAAEIAREAGAVVMRFAERRIGFELKGEQDLVTEADRASEKLDRRASRTHFPVAQHRRRRRAEGTLRAPAFAGTSIRSMARPISRTAFRSTT